MTKQTALHPKSCLNGSSAFTRLLIAVNCSQRAWCNCAPLHHCRVRLARVVQVTSDLTQASTAQPTHQTNTQASQMVIPHPAVDPAMSAHGTRRLVTKQTSQALHSHPWTGDFVRSPEACVAVTPADEAVKQGACPAAGVTHAAARAR
jgi:hypothetical protein